MVSSNQLLCWFFVAFKRNKILQANLLCVSASGFDCSVTTLLLHLVRLARDQKNESLAALKWVFPPLSPRYPPSSFSSLFSCVHSLPFLLLLSSSPPSFSPPQSSLSGHASDVWVTFLYAFFSQISIWFVISTLILSFFFYPLFCMMSVKMIAASINGTVSNLKEALSSRSTFDHKNLIKVSHLYSLVNGLVCTYMFHATCFPTSVGWNMISFHITFSIHPKFLACRRSFIEPLSALLHMM